MPKYQVGDVFLWGDAKVEIVAVNIPYGTCDVVYFEDDERYIFVLRITDKRLISGPTVEEAYAMNEEFDNKYFNELDDPSEADLTDDDSPYKLFDGGGSGFFVTLHGCSIAGPSWNKQAIEEFVGYANSWHSYNKRLEKLNELTKQDQESGAYEDPLNMDGTLKGLPDTGCDYEYSAVDCDNWFKCTILDKGSEGITAHCPHLEESVVQFFFHGLVQFRPIRTDEQRERDEFIKNAMQYGSIDPEELLGSLYDNGYRKL